MEDVYKIIEVIKFLEDDDEVWFKFLKEGNHLNWDNKLEGLRDKRQKEISDEKKKQLE